MIVIATFKVVEPNKGKEIFYDTYSKVDTLVEAKALYQQHLEEPNLYSASICGIIESTDYDPTHSTSVSALTLTED